MAKNCKNFGRPERTCPEQGRRSRTGLSQKTPFFGHPERSRSTSIAFFANKTLVLRSDYFARQNRWLSLSSLHRF